jgi:hypothetical protein
MRDLSKNECDALEALIDGCSINKVLLAMSNICGEKAIHIADNWQDGHLANKWAKVGNEIGILSLRAGGL